MVRQPTKGYLEGRDVDEIADEGTNHLVKATDKARKGSTLLKKQGPKQDKKDLSPDL